MQSLAKVCTVGVAPKRHLKNEDDNPEINLKKYKKPEKEFRCQSYVRDTSVWYESAFLQIQFSAKPLVSLTKLFGKSAKHSCSSQMSEWVSHCHWGVDCSRRIAQINTQIQLPLLSKPWG